MGPSTYVLDTSALLCYLRDERGAEKLHHLLTSKKDVLKMHRVNLGEVYYGVLKKEGAPKANQLYGMLLQYPVRYIDDLSDTFLVTTGRLKVKYNLGFADSFVAASTLMEQATLITKDNDFRPLEKDGLFDVLWI